MGFLVLIINNFYIDICLFARGYIFNVHDPLIGQDHGITSDTISHSCRAVTID